MTPPTQQAECTIHKGAIRCAHFGSRSVVQRRSIIEPSVIGMRYAEHDTNYWTEHWMPDSNVADIELFWNYYTEKIRHT